MAPANIICCLLLIVGVFHNIMGSNSTASQSHSPEIIDGRENNVKTITTRYGDVYDCIDFYKQPAFQHPQLKYHKFHPNIGPNFIHNITRRISDANVSQFSVLQNGGCPTGTVPIRRLSKQDHSQAANFSKSSNFSQTNNGQAAPPGTHYAIIQTNSSPHPPNYYGVGAWMTIWNPQVKENQYSASQITIRNELESLQVGWMVNPAIYKDTRTHMFIHTNAGQSHCYNTYCPGFVLVRSDFPPDLPMSGYSKPGKPSIYANFFIYRESKFGNWWLLVTPDLIPIGFWPGRIFSKLNKFGTYISCGGETYSPPGQPGGYPPMGSGEYPIDISEQDAFAMHFETANEKLQTIDVVDNEKYVDTKKYDVHDLGIQRRVGHVVSFGGYGG